MRKNIFIHFPACVFMLCLSAVVKGQTISTIAGCGIGNDSLAINAELLEPLSVAVDDSGNTYIADDVSNSIRKVSRSGIITNYAGNGVPGYSGDGGPATAAQIGSAWGVTLDRYGNLYFADADFSVVRKVNTAGIITTVAGTGAYGYNGDLIAATAAQLNRVSDIVADTSGNLYIADRFNYRVRKVNTAGVISTVAGTGTNSSTGVSARGAATATSIGIPFRVTLDKQGNLYIATYYGWNILKVDTTDTVSVIAGTGAYGYSGDGGPATAATFSAPCGITADTAGNVYFSDIDNSRIRMVNAATGIVTTYAGNGTEGDSGDGGPATSAEISEPEGLSLDQNNNLYITDLANNKIRRVSNTGIISTIAGMNGLFGEGYPALGAQISIPGNLATDAAGNVYIPDQINNRVRMVNVTTGAITTVAGTGIAGENNGFGGDGGPATLAQINNPVAVAIDRAGNLYIADQENNRIRMVNTSGIISTIAGNGGYGGYSGDGMPATNTELNYPSGVAVDATGNVYIADQQNSRIRMVNTAGIISTVAGSNTAGFVGDGYPATAAKLNYPSDVAVDGLGDIFIADYENSVIRKVDTAGIIHSITLYGTPGFSGDGDSSIHAQIYAPTGLKADSAGDVFFADAGNQRIRLINTAGIINTIAGNGMRGFSGDGGPAISAMLNFPAGIAADNSGNLYIADGNNFKIRKMAVPPYLSAPQTKPAQGSLLVYPNPTHDNITVSVTPLTGNEEISLYNAIGQQVYQSMLTTGKQTIDLAALPAGVYLLQLSGANGEKTTTKVTKY